MSRWSETGDPRDPNAFVFPEAGPLDRRIVYPGYGYPPNIGEDRPGLSPFGRLAKQCALGKSTVLRYLASLSDEVQTADNDILRIEGDDLDACQLIVTLDRPRVQSVAFDDINIAYGSNPTAADSNFDITGNFPGTAAPIVFPPFVALVKWGVRGWQNEAVVDFDNGVAFSVCASYLDVLPMVTQGDDVGVAGTSAVYQLAGSVGPGWTKGNAKRTVFMGAVTANTESSVFPVPAYAARIVPVGQINTLVPAIPAGFIRFWQSPNGQASGTCVATYYFSGNQPVSFDVPAGGMYYSIYNQAGVNMNVAAVFELALG